MVAHLVSLKLHLLRNGLRRSPWQVVSLVIGLLYGLGIAAVAVSGLVALRTADVELARLLVVAAGALLTLGWAVVPLVAFGTDATLDPARLVLFPVPARRLVPGLLAAGLVGVPGVVTALLGAATVVTWSRGAGPVLAAAVGAVLGVLTCVALSRLTTTAFAGALSGRRSKELVAGVLVLVAAVVAPAVAVTATRLAEGGGLDPALAARVVDVIGWTPLGWAWSAPAEVASGATAVGAVKLVLAASGLAGVLALWAAALARALVGGAGSGAGGSRARSAAAGDAREARLPGRLLARLERTPTGAVTARSLRYWRRDSRYLTALGSLVVVPVGLLALPLFTAVDPGAVALGVGPTLAFFVGWTSHNDVALDGTAVWLHLSAGVRGRADRWGRSLAVLVWGLPLVVAATVAGVARAGRWDLLPGLLGLVLVVVGAGQGVSAVSSALVPYRVPEPGANPFATPPGSAVTSALAQLATTTVILVVAAPVIGLVVGAAVVDAPGLAAALSWAALPVGAALGAAALWGGVAGGGRVFERRGPDLLAALAR